jgi:hypothetical protein
MQTAPRPPPTPFDPKNPLPPPTPVDVSSAQSEGRDTDSETTEERETNKDEVRDGHAAKRPEVGEPNEQNLGQLEARLRT